MVDFFIKRIKSFGPAFQGLFYMLKNEKNTWVHLLATIFAFALAIVLKISVTEWLFIISAIFLVWIAEFINTAIENTLDFITKEHHLEIKIIKDISAGFVLMAAFYSVVCASIIFLPYLF